MSNIACVKICVHLVGIFCIDIVVVDTGYVVLESVLLLNNVYIKII